MSAIVSAIDDLYEGCVTHSERWTDQAFQDWAEAVASADGMDRNAARYVRRALRSGQKLAAFWRTKQGTDVDDWRSRVDIALGARAWRPQLELAEYLLDRDRTEELFDSVARLFPVVHNEPYLDGTSFHEWQELHGFTEPGGSIDS